LTAYSSTSKSFDGVYRIRLTAAARRDLLDIEDYGQAHFGMASYKLNKRLIAKFRQLSQHPYSGRISYHLDIPIRSALVAPYVLFYVIEADCILVLRVLHQATSHPDILARAFSDEPTPKDD
jgi:plasmid stabilization system protein ParE